MLYAANFPRLAVTWVDPKTLKFHNRRARRLLAVSLAAALLLPQISTMATIAPISKRLSGVGGLSGNVGTPALSHARTRRSDQNA